MDCVKNNIKPRAEKEGIKIFCAFDEIVDVDSLIENPRNPNRHPDEQIKLLGKIIKTNGWRAPVTVSRRSGFIVRGHARRLAALKIGAKFVPIEYQDYESEASEYADLVADNRIAELAVLNNDDLRKILSDFDSIGYDSELAGISAEYLNSLLDSNADEEKDKIEAIENLKDKPEINPFSILDTRLETWLRRKNYWKKIGLDSGIGRGNDDDKTSNGLAFSNSCQPVSTYKIKNEYEQKIGKKISWNEFGDLFPDAFKMTGTSIFDPVLCETMYDWFCQNDGSILDPFSGGSVRGVVAAMCAKHYTGIDISQRQIEANKENWNTISSDTALKINDVVKSHAPAWICGDSAKLDNMLQPDQTFNMILSCPPYADLEKYSDDPNDISNMDYTQFLVAYRKIISLACARLKDNAFAVFVVSEVRNKQSNVGAYYNFVGDTIAAFTDAGLAYYNEIILYNSTCTATMRKQTFEASRKIIRVHQNVLVFVKGNPKLCMVVDK